MNGIRAKVDYILKHNMVINAIFRLLGSIALKILGVFFPTKNDYIIFSGHGRKYNDSPRAIYEYMIQQEKYAKLKYFWALEDPFNVEIPGPCEKIKVDTWAYFKTALQSHYWVTCVNIERGLHFKKKDNIYLNTWHGTPIKSISGDKNRKDDDFSYIDLFCTSGEFEKEIFKCVFSIPDEHLIYTGLPRNDELYRVDSLKIQNIKDKLRIPLDKKIILYAPTWRDSVDGGKTYSVKPPIDLAYWREQLGQKYILLMRTHPYTNSLLGIQFDDFVLDMTEYPNINDLFIIADYLISDYSAAIFDYSILERPIICFTYDIDEYRKTRGFSLQPETELPGGVLKTEQEVIDRIVNGNYDKQCLEAKKFKNKYLEYGGSATQQCVEALFKR